MPEGTLRAILKQTGITADEFLDARIIWLAAKKQTNLIATTDFNDFETYRLRNRKAFKILIER